MHQCICNIVHIKNKRVVAVYTEWVYMYNIHAIIYKHYTVHIYSTYQYTRDLLPSIYEVSDDHRYK